MELSRFVLEFRAVCPQYPTSGHLSWKGACAIPPFLVLPQMLSLWSGSMASGDLLQAGPAVSHSPLSRSADLTIGLYCLGGHMLRQGKVTSWEFLLLCELAHTPRPCMPPSFPTCILGLYLQGVPTQHLPTHRRSIEKILK